MVLFDPEYPTGGVQAVLWDADGVLQVLPGFDELWSSFLDEETRARLIEDLFADLPEVLTGRVDMEARVEQVVVRHGLAEHRERILATWTEVPLVEDVVAVVQEVRRAGTPCVLATNQDSFRERQMRPVYEPIVDRCYFSSAIGAAKPSAPFFEHVAHDLGVAPGRLLFVDDSQANVDGARSLGLAAERWHVDEGVEALRSILAGHGVPVG